MTGLMKCPEWTPKNSHVLVRGSGLHPESARLSLGPTNPRDGDAPQEMRTCAAPPGVLERLRKLHAMPR
jgi:hypothetical protein